LSFTNAFPRTKRLVHSFPGFADEATLFQSSIYSAQTKNLELESFSLKKNFRFNDALIAQKIS